jgi:hypothetical protein
VLAHIEATNGVDEVWISRDGNFVVVLPKPGEAPTDAVTAILAAEREGVVALDGTNRTTVLDLFADRTGWVQGEAGTARLSEEEAAIVGDRIAVRVAAAVPIDEPTRAAISDAIERRFLETVSGAAGDPAEAVMSDLASLPDGVRAAVRDAMSLGWPAVEGEQ